MTKRGDEGFLRRWSRRKRGGGGAPVIEAPAEPPSHAARAEPAGDGRDEAPAAGRGVAELPDIDSLDKDSDYTVFLREGVPEHLRRRALRKLWRSDPAFSVIDGLDDYDDDFTLMFTDAVTKSVKTAYRVGKGMVSPDEEEAEDAAETGDAASEPEPPGATAADAADADESDESA